ncbi:hypothetical protein HPP92_017291 [Vanilla planifolia]|uniref:Uncharacterized protein n=1 Tax=Vanilla planifolia TaxID=51239 RepID=A0A835USZ5_VANPL|nr:hypothetical protein HPP92_017291 [Vanilla planifolia]
MGIVTITSRGSARRLDEATINMMNQKRRMTSEWFDVVPLTKCNTHMGLFVVYGYKDGLKNGTWRGREQMSEIAL